MLRTAYRRGYVSGWRHRLCNALAELASDAWDMLERRFRDTCANGARRPRVARHVRNRWRLTILYDLSLWNELALCAVGRISTT